MTRSKNPVAVRCIAGIFPETGYPVFLLSGKYRIHSLCDLEKNMHMTKKKKNEKKNIIIPPTGVSENGRSIVIISQLHGILEEDIRIDLEKTFLTISAVKSGVTVNGKIPVPSGSRISKKKFHNGILEIILERPL